MTDRRFVVEYETDGEGTLTTRAFPTLPLAKAFAVKITKDDTAWPAEARVWPEIREDMGCRWEPDRAADPLDIICGEG